MARTNGQVPMDTTFPIPVPRKARAEAVRSLPRIRILAAIGSSVIILVVLVAATQLFWARRHLTDGAADLNAAIATVRSPSALSDTLSRNAAVAELRSARAQFSAARSDLDFWSPLLSTLGWVPHYGPELKAASPAATSAYFATSSALEIVRGMNPLWPLLGHHAHPRPLVSILATALAPGRLEFVHATDEASQGLAAINALPAETGNATVDSAAGKLRHDLPRLQAAGLWLSLVPRLLGVEAPRRYLFVWENADEIRATGGFIGAADLLTLRRGVLSKRFTGSALTRERPFSHVPQPEKVTTLEGSWLFRDANLSPDFPTSARLERWFYDRDTGAHVDGVIDFVDQGVPYVLQATGPVYLPQYHVTVNAHNALTLANRYASSSSVKYRGPHRFHRGGDLDTYRKQFFGFELSAIVKRLEHLPSSRWGDLGTAMSIAIRRHDILLWSRQPVTERAIRATGADGGLRRKPGDFLYIVDDNRSYNKIAPYIHEWATYHVDILPNFWLNSTLTIHYHLGPSPRDLEGQGPYFGRQGHNKHQFQDFLRVYIPTGAAEVVSSGLDRINQNLAQPAYGLTQISGRFLMSARQTRTIRIEYQIPANELSFGGFKRYRLTIPRQPGTRLNGVSVSIQGVGGVTVGPGPGQTTSRRWVDLYRDQSLTTRISGTGKPVLVPMSSAPSPDPWIPWKYLPGL
jgi:Protein of unknown function (DUF4012)